MDRYFGAIGYAISKRDGDICTEEIEERNYYGDILRANRRLVSSQDSSIDNIVVANRISIVADPFAMNNYYAIRYAVFHGVPCKVNSVELQYPRLILELGGKYNA